jgi:hypothetical protein
MESQGAFFAPLGGPESVPRNEPSDFCIGDYLIPC